MVKTFWNRKSNIEFRIGCGAPQHAEYVPHDAEYIPYKSALRNSASCGEFPVTFPQDAENMFQYSASVRNSAFKCRLMRGIGTNFPHHAEKSPMLILKLRRILRMMQKKAEHSPHAKSFFFFHFLQFDFRTMRKYLSNTPHENFRIKHAENGVSCGESRYG